MYLTKLTIQNVKLLRDFQLSFTSHGEPRMWTILIGANGLCKTAILHAIAMAASGHVRSNQLVDAASLPDRRLNGTARIHADFTFGALGHPRRDYPGLPDPDPPSPPGLSSSIAAMPGDADLNGSATYHTELSPSRLDLSSEVDDQSVRIMHTAGEMTLEQFKAEGVLAELSTVFDSEAAAFAVLDAIGFPDRWRPAFTPTPDFWEKVLVEIYKGLIDRGLERLLTTAARFYPHNPRFARWAGIQDQENGFNPLYTVRNKNLPDWFVAGYGTSRLLPRPGVGARPENPSLERVRTLFDQGKIIGTEFARILDHYDQFTAMLHKALIDSRILPQATGIELRDRAWARSADDVLKGDLVTLRPGTDEVRVPATWLSQGYQSTIAWIADIVGWLFFERRQPVPLHEMEGLVLIDEIDLHLHPTWQEELVPLVRRIFPRLQFVATTHSPTVLTGLKPEEIVKLRQDRDGNVVHEQPDEIPALLTGSQINERYFDLRRIQAARLGAAWRRYGVLSEVDPVRLDEEERQELESLHRRLLEAGVDLPGGRSRPER